VNENDTDFAPIASAPPQTAGRRRNLITPANVPPVRRPSTEDNSDVDMDSAYTGIEESQPTATNCYRNTCYFAANYCFAADCFWLLMKMMHKLLPPPATVVDTTATVPPTGDMAAAARQGSEEDTADPIGCLAGATLSDIVLCPTETIPVAWEKHNPVYSRLGSIEGNHLWHSVVFFWLKLLAKTEAS